ncbi:carbohydrate ABC transporter permease [Ruania rhizosphaerae]|uniref:carbohydrate ABC transporter permease n=1 Tax=Ruania rhizosphaerae TaxID=1840413 RepID=UPI00135B35CF|nr:carbohydrate ABC transporter permease [Ruania rhizosphaerae]
MVLAFVLGPLSWVILGSLKPPAEIFRTPLQFLPDAPTLQNYLDVMQRTDLGRYLTNSAIVAGGALAITLALASIAAYGFSRYDFRFKQPILVGMLVLQLMPSTVNVVPLYVMMNGFGLLNTRTALVLLYAASSVPFAIWILKGFFDTLPRSLDEAASIDGATRWYTFVRVILPLSLPGLSAAAFLSFLASWGEFLIPLVVANSREIAVMSVGIYTFFGEETAAYHYAFSASVLATAPAVLLYIFAQKYLMSGLAQGAEKG